MSASYTKTITDLKKFIKQFKKKNEKKKKKKMKKKKKKERKKQRKKERKKERRCILLFFAVAEISTHLCMYPYTELISPDLYLIHAGSHART